MSKAKLGWFCFTKTSFTVISLHPLAHLHIYIERNEQHLFFSRFFFLFTSPNSFLFSLFSFQVYSTFWQLVFFSFNYMWVICSRMQPATALLFPLFNCMRLGQIGRWWWFKQVNQEKQQQSNLCLQSDTAVFNMFLI